MRDKVTNVTVHQLPVSTVPHLVQFMHFWKLLEKSNILETIFPSLHQTHTKKHTYMRTSDNFKWVFSIAIA